MLPQVVVPVYWLMFRYGFELLTSEAHKVNPMVTVVFRQVSASRGIFVLGDVITDKLQRFER